MPRHETSEVHESRRGGSGDPDWDPDTQHLFCPQQRIRTLPATAARREYLGNPAVNGANRRFRTDPG